jgi:hypothetical protein
MVESLCHIIEESQFLLHIDISATNIGEGIKSVLESVRTAKHQTLISLHLHNNSFSIRLKDQIFKKLNIKTENYHIHNHLLDVPQDELKNVILSRQFIP